MSQPFGHNIPRLSWLGGKTYPTHFASRKNRPGNADLHKAALADDATRAIAVAAVEQACMADLEPKE